MIRLPSLTYSQRSKEIFEQTRIGNLELLIGWENPPCLSAMGSPKSSTRVLRDLCACFARQNQFWVISTTRQASLLFQRLQDSGRHQAWTWLLKDQTSQLLLWQPSPSLKENYQYKKFFQ